MARTEVNGATAERLRQKLQAFHDDLPDDEKAVFAAALSPDEDEVSGYFMAPSNKSGILIDNGRSVVVDNASTGLKLDFIRTGIVVDNGLVAFRPIVLPPSR